MYKEFIRHGASITIGVIFVKKGLDEVEKGNILIGAVLGLIGFGLILYNYYQGQMATIKISLSKVREWL